jgi:hypothetical protein
MGNVQIECTRTDVYWMHCQICGIDGPRTEDRVEADRCRTEHHRAHAEAGWDGPLLDARAMQYRAAPGTVEVSDSDSGRPVRVRFTLPQEWFTLPELRAFATYLAALADENEPSAEVEALAEVLEYVQTVTRGGPRAMARHLHQSGYRLEHPAEVEKAAG